MVRKTMHQPAELGILTVIEAEAAFHFQLISTTKHGDGMGYESGKIEQGNTDRIEMSCFLPRKIANKKLGHLNRRKGIRQRW